MRTCHHNLINFINLPSFVIAVVIANTVISIYLYANYYVYNMYVLF